MIPPIWTELPFLMTNDRRSIVYRRRSGVAAARQARRSGPLSFDGETQRRLAQALPPGSRLVACRAAVILYDDRGIRAADGFDHAPLPEGEPDAGPPDFFRAPEVALGLPTGVWRPDPNALSTHARIALTRAIGPIPEGLGATRVVRCRAGAVWGRADPRFIPEAVARG